MSEPAVDKSCHRGMGYGAFAFASVILTCYIGFFPQQRYFTSEWMVPVVFAAGAIYVAMGVLSGNFTAGNPRKNKLWFYYAAQCALLTVIIFLSPSRGFMGIIVLPVVSQAFFDLKPSYATLVGLFLFGIDTAVLVGPRGWSGVMQPATNYAAAFIFTIAFTMITAQALKARERETALREKVENANQQLRTYAAQAEELATTRERNRVAREIHDGVGHYLTVIKTQLDAALALLPSDAGRAQDVVGKAAHLAGDALEDVRRSVGSLRTDLARPPLLDALRVLTQESGLPVTIRVEGVARPLLPAVEHALYRTVQEGLTNVRKHAGASTAEVALDFRAAGRVLLAVTDDGQGTNTTANRGYGLRGLCERIELLGGRVESGKRSGGGFALKIEVPA